MPTWWRLNVQSGSWTVPNRLVGMDYRSLTVICSWQVCCPGDACVFPSFDDLRKNGAPGGRSSDVVVGCRCPSPPQDEPPDGCSRALSSSTERGPAVCWSHGRLVR